VEQLTGERGTIENALRIAQEQYDVLQRQIDESKAEHEARLTAERRALEESAANGEQQLRALAELEAARGEVERQRAQLEQAVEQLRGELTALQEQQTSAQTVRSQHASALDQLAAERSSIETALQAARTGVLRRSGRERNISPWPKRTTPSWWSTTSSRDCAPASRRSLPPWLLK
jgi:predicted  nucleic acid-binding Zn-ribbon protein